jgi:prepilin-type N-terminal cleavage/methylation domain-containing protein
MTTTRTHGRRARRARAAAGFTLIEVLVGMTITLIGLAGALSLHTTMANGNATAARTSRATAIAEQTLEDLRGSTIEQLIADYGDTPTLPIDGAEVGEVEEAGVVFARFLDVTETPNDPDLVRVRVEVRWLDTGGVSSDGQYDHTISFELIRTKTEAL